jgi:hypothetical protein
MPKPNPMFFFWVGLGWVKLQHLLPKPKPVLERFGFGSGWVGPGSTKTKILALFKGSGTFFGDQTMTQWSNHLPEPHPISFQVGLGWVWVR